MNMAPVNADQTVPRLISPTWFLFLPIQNIRNNDAKKGNYGDSEQSIFSRVHAYSPFVNFVHLYDAKLNVVQVFSFEDAELNPPVILPTQQPA
ncbi:hypothetical protein BC777_0160 [Yoonia maricola]|uniref:Uncharacterized protein n=1 Tax=Yoonia maricola TaxID=420999 RepID=A0A2M8WK78_9RHOB|nr:hypothetical protein BC777_0160 [Yoonia maricola]